MMRALWLCLLWSGLLAPLAAVEIIDLPDPVDDRYDLTWTLQVTKVPTTPLVLEVEGTKGTPGYQLRLEAGYAVWQGPAASTILPARAPLAFTPGRGCTLTFKRRPGTIALLRDHRLVLSAPAPTQARGTLIFRSLPGGLTLGEARYSPNAPLVLGDDFMRPEALKRQEEARTKWVEDDTWKVAYYRKDAPAADPPRDPKTTLPVINPWQLSLFPVVTTSANGFWFLYRGVGPSWAVAAPTMFYPSADRYFLEAAVKTEYDSEVGLIAAYQDNRNYLLFRWQPRDTAPAGMERAQLIAVSDGEQRVLASSPVGFAPGQWYQLRLNLGWRSVQALVDGEVLLQAHNPGTIEGRVGLYANGALTPRRPKLDEVTASMYVTTDDKTGKVINDAADAMRTSSVIYFDDVRVGDWHALPHMITDASYTLPPTGKWTHTPETLTAQLPGRYLTGAPDWSRYVATTAVKLPPKGSAGILLHLDAQQNGYLWTLATTGQKLETLVNGRPQSEVARTKSGLAPNSWATLRLVAEGPYIALCVNGTRVLEAYDPAHAAGRCGFVAYKAGVQFRPLTVVVPDRAPKIVDIHDGFAKDHWLLTWASPEAEWYPAFTPGAFVTPEGRPHAQIGAAAPLATNQPGLYWHKGGHYHDVHVSLPTSQGLLAGQTVHLASNYAPEGGYRLQVQMKDVDGLARLWRQTKLLGEYPFRVTRNSRLILERRGTLLLARSQELDPTESVGAETLSEQLVFVYRDPAPLPAEQVGFTVTGATLSAAALTVLSDRIQDTFERSPAGWLTESGVWAVMNRYSCQPQWNWFGGFGPGTPTVWSKCRLDGDQTLEVYMGVKMQYDNMPEEYKKRYRDLNVTICADGAHLNTGYTLIRASRPNEQMVTMLLRKGVVVKTSVDPRDLLPAQNQGHRQWFATRFEKRGAELKVFLDNRLAMTYVDPDPLPGGYFAFWTLNNGMMIGRTNFSAQTMRTGTPRAAVPLAVQQALPPRPSLGLQINGQPIVLSTFETDFDGWRERPGLTGRLIREREPANLPDGNTTLAVVNTFPAGDLSVTLGPGPIDLARTPLLSAQYCLPRGTQLNLYCKHAESWYELRLTGASAVPQGLIDLGQASVQADGQWHALEIDLGRLLREAVHKRTGSPPAALMADELVLGDWSPAPMLRAYGFGTNLGETTIRFDNVAFLPPLTGPLTLQAAAPVAAWRYSLDLSPTGAPKQEVAGAELRLPAPTRGQYLHLQAKDAAGKWGAVVHLALPAPGR
jgi:hypothetical protein